MYQVDTSIGYSLAGLEQILDAEIPQNPTECLVLRSREIVLLARMLQQP